MATYFWELTSHTNNMGGSAEQKNKQKNVLIETFSGQKKQKIKMQAQHNSEA